MFQNKIDTVFKTKAKTCCPESLNSGNYLIP